MKDVIEHLKKKLDSFPRIPLSLTPVHILRDVLNCENNRGTMINYNDLMKGSGSNDLFGRNS
jgi:hypothetical protein